MIKKITIIGSGNVATQLSLAFKRANFEIIQIISRNQKSGEQLAKKINTSFSNDIKGVLKSDFIIICVNDDNISSVVKKLPDIPVVHTSGNTSIEVLKNKKIYGVIYPVQSLSKERKINFNNVPVCVEASNRNFEKKLVTIIKKISNHVYILDSKSRKYLHLSAVITSNFSNYCYSISKDILDQKKIDFSLLKPLIIYTAEKTLYQEPKLNQTGPAKRGDKKTIKEHLEILDNKNYKNIYKLLSKNILKEYEK